MTPADASLRCTSRRVTHTPIQNFELSTFNFKLLLMKGRIWTVPNQITLLRLGFLPFFLILVLYEQYQWALFVLVFVALTDAIDGFLARRLGQKSALVLISIPSPINCCFPLRSWFSRWASRLPGGSP